MCRNVACFSLTLENLSPGTDYQVQVRAVSKSMSEEFYSAVQMHS